jgi:hypothetical protein
VEASGTAVNEASLLWLMWACRRAITAGGHKPHGLLSVIQRVPFHLPSIQVAAAMLVGRAYARPDAKCLLLDPTLSRGSAEPLMPSVEGDR